MQIQKDLYTVQRVVGRKKGQSGTFLYKIKWKGYPSYQNTWEPLSHLNYVQSLIKRYDENYYKIQSRKRKARSKIAQSKGDQNSAKSKQKARNQKSFDLSKNSAKVPSQNFKNQNKKKRQNKISKKHERLTQPFLNQSDSQNVFLKGKAGALIQIQKHSTSIEQNGEMPLIHSKTKRKPRKNKSKLQLVQDRQKHKIRSEIKRQYKKKMEKNVQNLDQESSDSSLISEDSDQEKEQKKLQKSKNNNNVLKEKKGRPNPSSEKSLKNVKKTKKIKKKTAKWFQLLIEVEKKQEKRLELKVKRKSLTVNKSLLRKKSSKKPFIIALRRRSRQHIQEHLPNDLNPPPAIISKAKLQKDQKRRSRSTHKVEQESKQKRTRKISSYAEIFINNKLGYANPTNARYIEKYTRANQIHVESEQPEESEQNQIITLKQKLQHYDQENKANVNFGEEACLKITMKNEDEQDCEFNIKDLRTFYGEWLKSFYQQYI